jgi:hypothetical protein
VVARPTIVASGKQRQEDQGFEASLGYKVRPCQKANKQRKTSTGKDVEKQKASFFAGKNAKWCCYFRKLSKILKMLNALRASNFISRYIIKRNKMSVHKNSY